MPISEALHFDLENYDLVLLGSPKWSLGCPPFSQFVQKIRNSSNKNAAFFMTFGGFDEKRYASHTIRQLRKKGLNIVDSLLIESHQVETGDYTSLVDAFCWRLLRMRNTIHASKIKAIIFDFDGTLADSIGIYWQAFNDGVTSVGLRPVQKNQIVDDLSAGIKPKEILTRLFPKELKLRKDIVGECTRKMRVSFRALWSEGVMLFPRTANTIRNLSSMGLKIAIVTGRSDAANDVREILHSYSLNSCVGVVVSGEEVAERKPAPDIIIKGAKRLHVKPGNCLVVGDSIVDIMASKAAGAHSVAVTTGVGRRRKLAEQEPDFILRSVADLPGLFRANRAAKNDQTAS